LYIAIAIGVLVGPVLTYFLFFHKGSAKKTNGVSASDKDKTSDKTADSKRPKGDKQDKDQKDKPARRQPKFDLEDFTVYGGNWQAAGDEVSVNRGPGFKLISNGPVFSTGEVGVEVRLPDRGGGNAGLIVKVREPGLGTDKFIGYGIYLSGRGKGLLIVGRHQNNWQLFKQVHCRVADRTYVNLVVRLRKNFLTVLVNGEQAFPEELAAPLDAGTIGLRSFWSACSFRDLWVKIDGRKITLPFGPDKVGEEPREEVRKPPERLRRLAKNQ
jgi:hypothetical protein